MVKLLTGEVNGEVSPRADRYGLSIFHFLACFPFCTPVVLGFGNDGKHAVSEGGVAVETSYKLVDTILLIFFVFSTLFQPAISVWHVLKAEALRYGRLADFILATWMLALVNFSSIVL